MKAFIYYCLLMFIFSTANYGQNKVPHNFNFKFSNYSDEFNSANSKLRRRMAGHDTTIKIQLTDTEKADIYESMQQNDVFNLPNEIHTSGNCMFPYTTYYLSIKCNRKTKNIKFYENCSVLDENGNRFVAIRKKIMNALSSKPQYINLPKSHRLRL